MISFCFDGDTGCETIHSYSDVTWVSWHLKYLATSRASLPVTNNKENSKAPLYWPFVSGSIVDQWIPLTKTNNVESVSMSWHNQVICLLVPQATWFTGGADVRLRFWHDTQRVSIIFCHYCIRVIPGTHFKENASEYDVCKISAISSRSQQVNLSFRTLTGASGAMLLRFLSNFRVIGIGQF